MGKKNKGKKKKTGNKKPVAAAPASAEPKVENVEETVAAVESGEPTSRNSTVEVAEKNSMASSEEAVDGVVDRQQDAAQGVKDDETSPAEVSQAIEAEPNNETGVDVFSGVKKPTGEMITTGETMNKESLSAGASNNDGGGISAEDPNTQTPEQNSEDTKEETISQQQENAPVVTESSSGADGGTVPDLKSGENDVNDCVNSKVEEKQEIVSVKAEPKDSKSNADVVQNSEISTGGKELDYAIIMDTEDISEKEQEIAPVEEEEEFTAAEHLVNLHQPKDMCEADNKSLDEFDLFDDEPEERPSKPILAAALKASEQLKAEDNGTAHLTGLHQPRDRCDTDNKSLDEFDLFDDELEQRPSKPILAAALKAAEQLKAEDSGTLHLAELHQPKDLCEADNKSLDEIDLFDDEPEERPSKPMLAAALKASEQLKGDSSTDNANKKEQSGQKGDTSALSGSEESKVGGGNPVDTESSVAESAENVVEENKQEQNETSVPKDDILNKEREEVKEKEMTEKNNSLDDANKAPVIKEGIVSEPTSMGVNINVEASTVQDAEKDKTPSEVGEKLSVAFQTPPPIQKNYKRPQGGRASGTVASGFQSPAVSKRQSMQSARERELEELRQRGLASNSVDTKYIKFEKMSPEGGKCPDPDSDSLVLSQTKWRNDNQRKGGDNRVVYEREQLSSESTEDGPKEIGPNKEFPFVFRLVYAKDAEEPDEEICNNAAANIVPKTLVGKDKVTYNPNYPPVVSSIELDNDFHESEQVRYIIRGKIPVFAEDGYDSPPAKSSKSSRRKSKKKSKSKSSEQRRLSKEFSGAGNSKGEEGTAADETEVRNSNASAEEGRRREEQPTPISELSDERQTEDSTSVSNKAVIPNSSAEPDPSWEPSAVENVTKDAPISGSNEVTKESPVEATPSIAPSVVEKAAEDDIIPSSDEVAKQKANGDFFRPSPSKKPPSQETLAKRQSAKDMELEALRQRGLAKKENKTFSQLEQESAVEKAAYEAEKRDLETRKANTSEYRYSGNAHINPKDALYMSQTKMKNEYRQKERETLLQNQRHSHSSESALLYAKPMVRDKKLFEARLLRKCCENILLFASSYTLKASTELPPQERATSQIGKSGSMARRMK